MKRGFGSLTYTAVLFKKRDNGFLYWSKTILINYVRRWSFGLSSRIYISNNSSDIVIMFTLLLSIFQKIKRERKLNSFESSIYIITKISIFLCTGSYLLLFLDRNYG